VGSFLAARGRLSVREVIELGIRLTDVLGDAHVAGVIHRDLKPSHVFSLPGGGVKLIDFASASVPELFETEETAGMLFELLTGTVPYPGSPPAVILRQARGAPPSLRTLRPDVPTAVRTAIERCLALELDERYTSVADLAVDLELARDFPAVSVCSRRPPLSVPGLTAAPHAGAKPLVKVGTDPRRFGRAPFTTPSRSWGSTPTRPRKCGATSSRCRGTPPCSPAEPAPLSVTRQSSKLEA
jgi:serine/threonine protein kinase